SSEARSLHRSVLRHEFAHVSAPEGRVGLGEVSLHLVAVAKEILNVIVAHVPVVPTLQKWIVLGVVHDGVELGHREPVTQPGTKMLAPIVRQLASVIAERGLPVGEDFLDFGFERRSRRSRTYMFWICFFCR